MLSFLKTIIKIIPVLAAAGLISVSILIQAYAQDQILHKGRINSYRLNLRNKPSLFAKVVIILEKDDIVDVLEEKGGVGGWLKVRYENYSGYIRNREQYIKLLPAAYEIKAPVPGKTAKVTAVEKEVVQEKQKIKEKIKEEQEKVESFSAEESQIIEGLDEIDFALNRARVSAGSLAEEMAELEERIRDLTKKQKKLAAQIEENKGYTGRRLDALYRMNMIGRLEIAGPPQSVFDFFLKQNSMKRIIQSDFDMIEKQSDDMKEMVLLGRDLEEQHLAKLELEGELKLQIRIKEKESQKKETILKDIQNKKKLSLAAVASLKEAEGKLDARIENIRKNTDTASHSFSKYKGKLGIPVKGEIISSFGPSRTGDYKSFTFQSGIDIRAERGEPVKCIFMGEVLFAEWLKGYGNVMIVNHGESYYSLYAHVEEIFKKPGERVQTGEVIATAGDTGSIKGLCLHFELRHHGKPIDPINWLKKGV